MGGEIVVRAGRYGPYASHNGVNATLPSDKSPDTITLEEAVPLIDARLWMPDEYLVDGFHLSRVGAAVGLPALPAFGERGRVAAGAGGEVPAVAEHVRPPPQS